MLAFELEGGREAGERFMDALELCGRATSLGGVDAVAPSASTSHRQYSPEQLAAAGISAGLLRLSVGCEDAGDIVADLDQALAQAQDLARARLAEHREPARARRLRGHGQGTGPSDDDIFDPSLAVGGAIFYGR